MPRLISLVLWAVIIVMAAQHYQRGIKKQWKTNPMLNGHSGKSYDQPFYVEEAREFAVGDFGLGTARSRMPLYPWLMAFDCEHGLDEHDQLEQYMRLNVKISFWALGVVALLFAHVLGVWWGAWAATVLAFHIFLFKATLVQPEVLFYTLYFIVFLGMCDMLRRPSWGKALALGLGTGLCYLIKGSALPLLAVFVMLGCLRAIALCWREWKTTRSVAGFKAHVLPVVIFLGGFFNVTGYYMINSYRWYGSPVYDPNSRYYLWADSSDEMWAMQVTGLAFTKPNIQNVNLHDPDLQAHLSRWVPDEAKRSDLVSRIKTKHKVVLEGEDDILPGPANYFKRHTWKEALDRMVDGVGGLIEHNRHHPDGYWKYLEALAALAVGLSSACFFKRQSQWSLSVLARHKWIIALAVFSIGGNVLLYGWWAPVSNRNRFFLTQYLPLLFCLAWIIQRSIQHLDWRWTVRVPKIGTLNLTPELFLQAALTLWVAIVNHHLHTGHTMQ